MKKYTGGCHCGAVRFEVEMEEPTTAMTCNCSHCSIKGFMLAFVPAKQFTLLQGEDMLTLYHFHKEVIDHKFCKICGVESFANGKGPDGSETVMVNLRCVDDLDISKLPVHEFDGKKI